MAIRNAKSLSMFTTGSISLNRFYELDLFFWNKMTKFWFCLHFVNFFVNFYVNIFVEVFTSEWVLAACNYPNSKVVSWLNRKVDRVPCTSEVDQLFIFMAHNSTDGRTTRSYAVQSQQAKCCAVFVAYKKKLVRTLHQFLVRNASLI